MKLLKNEYFLFVLGIKSILDVRLRVQSGRCFSDNKVLSVERTWYVYTNKLLAFFVDDMGKQNLSVGIIAKYIQIINFPLYNYY